MRKTLRKSGVEIQHTPLTIISLENRIKEWLEGVNNRKLSEADLETALSDGILLCRTMLVLDSRSIPKYHSGGRSTVSGENKVQLNPVHIRENVSFFIEAVLEYGVPRYRIFFDSDITAEKASTRNYVRVLECIEALAMTAGANGFPLTLASGADDGTLKISDFNGEELRRADEILERAQKKSHAMRTLKSTPVSTNLVAEVKSVIDNNIMNSLPSTTAVKEENKPSKVPLSPSIVSDTPPSTGAQLERGIIGIQGMIRAKIERRNIIRIKRREAFRDKIASILSL